MHQESSESRSRAELVLFWIFMAAAAAFALSMPAQLDAQTTNLGPNSTQIRGILQPENGGLGLDASSATGCWHVADGMPTISAANCVTATAGVTLFNGRAGSVTLAQSDVSAAGGLVASPSGNQTAAQPAGTTFNVTGDPGALRLNGTPVVPYVAPSLESFLNNRDCATQICKIKVIGDSFVVCDITNCGVGPTTSTNRWAEQLRIAWQNQYGSYGTGIIPVNVGTTNGAGGSHLNIEAWSCTGSFDFNTNTLGPYQTAANAQNSLLHLGNGAVCTFHDSRGIKWGGPVGGLVTYCMTSASSGSLAVSIDSGSVVGTACGTTTGSATAHAVQLADATESAHTVTFTSSGDGYLYGAEGTSGTSGVAVDLIAVSGSMAEMFNSANKLAFSNIDPAGTQGSLVAFLTNDVNFGESTANFSTYLSTIISNELGLSGAPPVAEIIDPVSNIYSAGAQAPYVTILQGLCATLAVNCLNIQNVWGTAYSNTNNIWYLGHPNDAGSTGEYSILFNGLTSPAPTVGTVSGVSYGAMPAVTAANFSNGGTVFASSTSCPNLTVGEYCVNVLGSVDGGTKDGFNADFYYAGSGSAGNYELFNFSGGGANLIMFGDGSNNIGTLTHLGYPLGLQFNAPGAVTIFNQNLNSGSSGYAADVIASDTATLTLSASSSTHIPNANAAILDVTAGANMIFEYHSTAVGSYTGSLWTFNQPIAAPTGSTVNGSAICTTATGCGGTSYSLGGTLSSGNVTLGAGAGSGGGVSSIFVTGVDATHTIGFETGSTTVPTANATILTTTFTAARSHSSSCTFSPSNEAAAALYGTSQVIISYSAGGTGYTLTSGTTALAPTVTYEWNFTCP